MVAGTDGRGARPSDAGAADRAPCRVELYGTARLLAGQAAVQLDIGAGARLGDIVIRLGEQLPALVGPVIDAARRGLMDGYIFNRNGRDFVTDPLTAVQPGDRLLLLAGIGGG